MNDNHLTVRRVYTMGVRARGRLSRSISHIVKRLKQSRHLSLLGLGLVLVLSIGGCGRTEVNCDSHSDCASNEACIQSLCVTGEACVEGLCPSTQQCVADICVDLELLPNECNEDFHLSVFDKI